MPHVHESESLQPKRRSRRSARSRVEEVAKEVCDLDDDIDDIDDLDDEDDEPLDPDEIAFPSEEPFEDHVAESKRHFAGRTKLWNVTEDALENVSIGSDQFVYYDSKNTQRCLAPDAFIKLESSIPDFDKWKTWELGIPELAVELASKSDRLKLTWKQKLRRYTACGVKEIVRFDRKNSKQWLRVWDRVGKKLVERKSGVYECKTLELFWVIKVHAVYGPQLRLARDRQGDDLLPSPSERLSVATGAQLRAEQLARDAEQKQRDAEHRQRAEADARTRAEAELERLKLELEHLRACR